MKELQEKATQKGLGLEVIQVPHENREESYWYGGEVAHVVKGNTRLILEANGDVRAYYRSLDENGEENEIFVRDKTNDGAFYRELQHVIKDDAALEKAVDNWNEGNYPQLEIEDNNWWEVFVVADGEWHDIYCVVEANTYTEALESLIDNFEDYANMIVTV